MGRELNCTDEGGVNFFEAVANGENKIGLFAPASLASTFKLTLLTGLPGSTSFLTVDATGQIAVAAGSGTSSLDDAYNVGRIITVDSGGAVEMNVPVAQAHIALVLSQASDQGVLSVTKTGAGAGVGIASTNAGTGIGIEHTQNGAGIGFKLTQNGLADAAQIIQATNDNGLFIQKTAVGGGDAFLVQNLGTAPAVRVDQDGDGFGIDVDIAAASTSSPIRVVNAGTGTCTITQSGVAKALQITQSAGAIGVQIDHITGAGNSLLIDHTGSQPSLNITHRSSGVANVLTSLAPGTLLDMVATGSTSQGLRVATAAGNSIELNKTGSGSTNPCLDINHQNSDDAADAILVVLSNGTGMTITSTATNRPLIALAPVTGNTRGDIAFGTARTAAPTTPSEGDLWFETGLDRLSARVTAAVGTTTVASRFGPDFGTIGSANIVAGAVGANNGRFRLAAETGVADDLDTLTAPAHIKSGDTIILLADAGDTITVKHATGNIRLDASADKVLVNGNQLMVIYDGTNFQQLTPMMVLP